MCLIAFVTGHVIVECPWQSPGGPLVFGFPSWSISTHAENELNWH